MKKLKKLLLDMDRTLLVVSIILFVFGLLNIVNASSQAVVIKYNTSLYNYFYKQLFSLIVGLVATIFILRIPTKKYYLWGLVIYIFVLLLLAYLSLYGRMYQGSINWIPIGSFSLQPSEFAKPAMIIMLGLLFERFYKKLQNEKLDRTIRLNLIGIIILIGCLFPVLVFFQKDLGTTIILISIFGLLFLFSPILKMDKFITVVFMIFVLMLGCLYMLVKNGKILTESQLSRFDFYDPCSDYENGGYQICNGFIAINDGGLLGVGIGKSKQVSYIPESHTDSVFAIISEEYGFIICSVIFFLYLVVLYRIFNLACRASTIRGKYMCFGVGIYIALHIIVNLGGLFGSMPLTGVPLPFLSYGGSFTLALMCSLAVVQRISIETNNQKIKV